MSISKLKTLILGARDSNTLSYYDDWIDAFSNESFFSVDCVNIYEANSFRFLKKTIPQYHLIVLLHSITRIPKNIIYFNRFEQILQRRKGKILAFVGDELNLYNAFLSEKIEFLKRLRPEYIGTQLPLEAGTWLYEGCRNSSVIPLPHALNPKVFQARIPQESRPLDIAAISMHYPPFLGDNERERIFQFFSDQVFSPPLVIDMRLIVDERKRLSRQDWCNFLNTCRGTVSTEAGTYFLEKDDKTVKAITAYLISKQKAGGRRVITENSMIRKLWDRMPMILRSSILEKKDIIQKFLRGIATETEGALLYENANFNEIYEIFFKTLPISPFYSKAISSRHFEAIGTKTCQIMFPGRFNDILTADRHYLALGKDFSNISAVMEKFRDFDFRRHMVDETYQYIMDTNTFHHRMIAVSKLFE